MSLNITKSGRLTLTAWERDVANIGEITARTTISCEPGSKATEGSARKDSANLTLAATVTEQFRATQDLVNRLDVESDEARDPETSLLCALAYQRKDRRLVRHTD
ncbi:hypothetical protein N7493_011589 [Penicillium malachiteum]|uniref:Uncharacterized protein n=1 Tax=Penicillium malachiteum TaxID=1324776 RepID=A0AAD6HB12_9EURO|nr:hypothetical protein N7493_011589 [Penicillium malachiteum]